MTKNSKHSQATETIDVSSLTSIYVRYGDLFISASNVRQSEVDEQGIVGLAAMIEAQGLLSALHVCAEMDENGAPTGRSGVDAGGRRYRALGLLHAQGKITDDTLIECKRVEKGRSCEVSLAENLGFSAMHPADEFAAYQTLITDGATVESIATKFGVSVVHVLRRLKMAKVAPELITLYRKGELTLDQVQALATTDDQERQVQVWNALPQWGRGASSIKRKLQEDEISESDPRVKLIGLPAYIAAGGSIRKDLFSEEDENEQFLTDLGLVELLVGECMQARSEELRGEGWGWVETLEHYGYEERIRFTEAPKVYLPETEEQAAHRSTLETEIAQLDAQRDELYDQDETDETEKAIDKLTDSLNALDARLSGLKEMRLDTSDLDKGNMGAIVILGDDGIEIKRGLVMRCKATQVPGDTASYQPAAKVKAEVPEKLMLNLTAHRTAAIQASMLSNHAATLAALAFTMALSVFHKNSWESTIKISLQQSRFVQEKNSPTIGESRAAELLDMEMGVWREALPQDSGKWFAWFLEQPQDKLLAFIVFATALCADVQTPNASQAGKAAELEKALSLDMADWWDATPENYLDLVPKSKLMEAVREVGSEAMAQELLKLKKLDAVNHARQALESKRWLPKVLRRIEPSTIAGEDDLDDDSQNENDLKTEEMQETSE